MKTDKQLLEHDLCPRLPYGVKMIGDSEKPLTLIGFWQETLFCEFLFKELNHWQIKGSFLPIYHPMTDLTKPITHKGETFVPIERLLEMVNDKYINQEYESFEDKFTYEDLKIYGGEGFIFVRGSYEDYQRIPLITDGSSWECPLFLSDKLDEWMFNHRNLPAHLWVDVNSLETNPYA